MANFDELSGVANNLADSFVSVTNMDFLKTIEFLPLEKTELFEIDLLKGTITPEDLMGETGQKAISRYKNWFLSEIKRLKIELKDIEKVLIKVSYKSGKALLKCYTCSATITAKGKKYIKKVMSSYS